MKDIWAPDLVDGYILAFRYDEDKTEYQVYDLNYQNVAEGVVDGGANAMGIDEYGIYTQNIHQKFSIAEISRSDMHQSRNIAWRMKQCDHKKAVAPES